jgi:TonB family protein
MSNKQLRPNNALHRTPSRCALGFPRSLRSLGAGVRPLMRRVTLLGSFLLYSCAQPSQPPQPPQRPEPTTQTQAILPPQVASVPFSEAASAPTNEPAAYSDHAAYAAAIRTMVRKNLILPRNVPDSASAIVEVVLSDTGAVAALRTLTSSGFPAYDAAIRRAIRRAQPYPLLLVPGRQGPMTMRLRFQIKE